MIQAPALPSAGMAHALLPHGPLQQLSENLWALEGDLPTMPLKRWMVIARMADGALVIHNGVAVEEEVLRQIEALGAPRWLVVPNGWHRLDAAFFRARFPGLKVIAPAGGRARVEKVVPVDADLEGFPGDDLVKLETLDGVRAAEGVMRVRSQDGVSLVFTDAVFNLPARLPGMQGFILHDVIGSKPGPRVTRVGRLLLAKDRRAFRAHLERLAETPDLRRVLVAHGAIESTDPRAMLRTAAATL